MNSNRRNSLIACAVATALGSSMALALPPTTTPDFIEYAAGGSAQANAFFVAASTILTNVDSYSDATGCADSGSYRVLFGSVKTTFSFNGTTIAAGKNVLYFYKFNGGSFPNGVAPQVGSGVTLAYPNASTIIPGTTTFPLPTAETCTNAGAPNYTYSDSGQLTNNNIPDWGVADVEVPMFQGYNNPGTCATAVTTPNCFGPAAPTVGASDGIYDNLFGIAVTHNVFTSATHPKTNFSRAEMAGIIAGTISDWSQLYDDNGKQMAAGGIIFLDRTQGSGTKASGSEYFLGYPGDGASAGTPFSASNGYTSNSLVNSNVSQDVGETSTSNVINDLINAQNDGLQAVAILGLENPPALHQGSGSTNLYDFCKINGVAVDAQTASDNINGTVATNYDNVVTGVYDFYYQNSFNTRSTNTTATGNAFANQFKTVMQAVAFVGANSSVKFPGAVNGTLQDADKESSQVAGVSVNTRNRVSTGPLTPKFSATSTGVVLGSDPL